MNQTDSPFLWLRNRRNVDTFTDLFNGGIVEMVEKVGSLSIPGIDIRIWFR